MVSGNLPVLSRVSCAPRAFGVVCCVAGAMSVGLLSACSSDTSTSSIDPPKSTDRTAIGGTGGGDSPATIVAGVADPATSNETSPDSVAAARHKAEMLTSIWENSTTVLQYSFSRNNHDGYGYTSGRAGFTTATSDSWFVVECFDTSFGTSGANLMHKYATVLSNLSKKQQQTGALQPTVSGLDALGDYNGDWTKTAMNATTAASFAACQDEIVEQLYFEPTLAIARKWGLVTALSMALLYDSTIVHGQEGASALAKQANDDTGNGTQVAAANPKSLPEESAWLASFLVHRVALLNGSDAWRGAIDRAANYEKLRKTGNFDFERPIVTDAKTNALFSGGPYVDGGYPHCVIATDGSVTGDPACTAQKAD